MEIGKPSTANNYVKLRRGLLDHLINGNITWDQYAFYTILLIKANSDTGIVMVNYSALAREIKQGVQVVRRFCIALAQVGFILVQVGKAGSPKPVQVIIHKYPCSDGHYTNCYMMVCRGNKDKWLPFGTGQG